MGLFHLKVVLTLKVVFFSSVIDLFRFEKKKKYGNESKYAKFVFVDRGGVGGRRKVFATINCLKKK